MIFNKDTDGCVAVFVKRDSEGLPTVIVPGEYSASQFEFIPDSGDEDMIGGVADTVVEALDEDMLDEDMLDEEMLDEEMLEKEMLDEEMLEEESDMLHDMLDADGLATVYLSSEESSLENIEADKDDVGKEIVQEIIITEEEVVEP